METSLLTTKLFIPPARPGLVARPRLMERLQAALGYGLVLVSAPAGFGKTTLASEWARQTKDCRTAWVSLDEGDNDPVRFWDYFIAAVKTIQPSAGETALSLLHSPQPYPTESVVTALINDLTNTQDGFAIVLDDYHLIKAEPVQAGVNFLLDHLPPKMHLVIATRVDPLLPISQFRGRGMMLEIGAEDLRFTLEEAAAMLKEGQTVTLTEKDISTLNERTEGWAVGLKMAALSMLGQKDIEKFIAAFTGSQRYIMDYLVEQVLEQQPDEVRDFLLTTSVLERLTAPLCDYLTGSSSGQEMLGKLESAFGGFLVPLDGSRQWYRYHHLFADLLRHQLEAKSGAKEKTPLHQRASQWYEDNEFNDDAIHHALVARDWERAMRLIYSVSEARIKRGEWSTLFNWFRLIPDEILRSNPRLYSHYANVLMSFGSSETVEAMLTYLERTALDDTSLQGEVALFRSILAHRKGDDTERLKSAEKALELLPPDNLAMRARAAMGLGIVKFDTGHLEEAWSSLTEAYEMARLAGDYWVSASALAYLSGVFWLRGEFRRATELMQQTIELVGHSPAAAIPTSWLGLVKYEQNDLEGAASNAKLANELNELGGQGTNRIHNYFYLAQVYLVQGDVAAAKAVMEKSDQLLFHPHMSEEYRAIHMAYHILFALHQNKVEDAVSWGKRLSEHNCAPWVGLWWVPARLLIARGEKAAASAQLQDLYQRAVMDGAQSLVIWVRVCQVLAAETTDEALSFLSDALVKGEPEGFIRTFVDEGKLLAPLLRKLLDQGFLPEYTSKLLNIIEAEERQRQTMRGEVIATPQTTALLSGRELEILRLLAAGLSNRHIAEKLFISLNTVKRHVHNISQKLDTQTRTRAIARARELKLL